MRYFIKATILSLVVSAASLLPLPAQAVCNCTTASSQVCVGFLCVTIKIQTCTGTTCDVIK